MLTVYKQKIPVISESKIYDHRDIHSNLWLNAWVGDEKCHKIIPHLIFDVLLLWDMYLIASIYKIYLL